MSERRVQYEFKVIVWADAEAYPFEVRAAVNNAVKEKAESYGYPIDNVVSVEQVRDY